MKPIKGGQPPQAQVDINDTEMVKCDDCGNASFIQAFFLRKLLANSQVTDFAELYKLMYDEVDSYATGHIAECILIIAKYQLSDGQVVDKEINAMAMIIEILGVIK